MIPHFQNEDMTQTTNTEDLTVVQSILRQSKRADELIHRLWQGFREAKDCDANKVKKYRTKNELCHECKKGENQVGTRKWVNVPKRDNLNK